MEAILTILIVVVVVFWACWSSYRTLTGKSGGCSCAAGCKKHDCSDRLNTNDKNKVEK